MTTIRTSISLLLLLLVLPAGAQPPDAPLSIGLTAGYGRGFVSGEFPVFNGSPACGIFDGGSEAGTRLGSLLTIPKLIGGSVGFRIGLSFSHRTESFVAAPVDPQPVRDPQLGTIVDLEREYRHTSTFNRLELELLGSGAIGDRLRWFIGPTLSYRTSASFEQYDYVTGPENFLFEDGEVRHVMEDRYPLSTRPIELGALFGTGYRLSISERIAVQPELYLRFTFPGGVAEYPRTTVGGDLRLALHYSPAPPPEPPPLLSASLDLFCVDRNLVRSDTARLTLSEVAEEVLLFLPTELSGEGDDLAREHHLLSREQTDSFRSDSVPGRPQSVRYELLNIIGRRLRENAGAELILSGSVRGNRRRDSIIAYLRDVWSIPEERIVPDSSSHASSGDHSGLSWRLVPEVLNAPLRNERIAREHGYPTIRLSPRIIADAGVRSWSITIAQGETILARYTEERETRDPDGIPWESITTGSDGSGEPLIATLSVVDSGGGKAMAEDTLPVHRTSTPEAPQRRRIISIPVTSDPDSDRKLRTRIATGIIGIDQPTSVSISLPTREKQDGESLMKVIQSTLNEAGVAMTIITVTGRHTGEDIRMVIELR